MTYDAIYDPVHTLIESAVLREGCDGRRPGSYSTTPETLFGSVARRRVNLARTRDAKGIGYGPVSFGHLPLDPELTAFLDGSQLDFELAAA